MGFDVRSAAIAAACATLALAGCKEEKKASPVAPAPQTQPAPASAAKPAAPPEPTAEKECAAPIDVTPPTDVQIGDRAAKRAGYKLSFQGQDADGALVLGVLGPINEDTGANLFTMRKYLQFFKEQKADAIVVTGDVGETADSISRALVAIAEAKVPVLVLAGNVECRADFTDGVERAQKTASNVVNLNQVRAVEFPQATLVSLPGYHDPTYMRCETGCRYYKANVDEVVRVAKEAKTPAILVSHGPPKGEGGQALDRTADGNVGDPEINRAIKEGDIAFGFFSNIKEAGARAVETPEGSAVIREGQPAKKLYLNPGPADTMGWELNDGTKSAGMAAVFKLQNGEGSFTVFRAKPLTAAEKAQARALDPAQKTATP